MAGEYGIIWKVMEPIKSFVFDALKEYVGYIRNCEGNLDALHKCLNEVCIKKDDVNKKVKVGNANMEGITTVAANWLHAVCILTEDEELKELMYKDIETAKFVVKMMGEKDLKRRISKEHEMQEVVVKVIKKLKEEIEQLDEGEMRNMRYLDYKQVAEVVVEVMKDTLDEFNKLLKEDKKMAIIATRTLKKLTKDDEKMKGIVTEAGNGSDEEQWPNHVLSHVDEESNVMQPLLVKIPSEGGSSNNNTIEECAKILFTPLASLIIPLGKLMDDADFKKAVPQAEGVKLGLEVIDELLNKGCGLKMDMDGHTEQQSGCCCCSMSLSLCHDYHGRYLISKSAKLMAKHIQDDIISKCPPDSVTLQISSVNLKHIPTQFLKALDSRTTLLLQILENLNDDHVHAIGLFGMGGTGKTTLAKEVIASVKSSFAIKVMVEVSHAPNFVGIQAAIAQSIDLPMDNVYDVAQRANRLYSRLIELEMEKKVLIILDNVWQKLNLYEIGIPRTCKLLLTTRDKEVCRVMDVRDVNIFEVGVMKINEARELFKSQIGNQVDLGEYKNVVERLLSKCGGLPLTIVTTANSLKDKDFSSWENFADEVEKPISSQYSGDYHNTFTILNTSYKFIKPKEKRIFFLLACLSPVGSSISVESLMRYGVGLRLFEHVNKLSEAMKRAVTWADELMLSSMLLKGDVKGDLKIHDIVRDFGISYVAKEEKHMFLVEGLPRWLEDETLKKYTAMSLTSKSDYSRLSGVKAFKLHILILKGDLSPSFDESFFLGMVNLEVLALSNMNFQPSLPESMRKLKKLRTLCMEGCKLGNIELLGELVNLLILGLRESSLENLPNEIGNLSKLRLLDLNGCTSSITLPLIPAHILNKLSRLEGLYMYTDKQPLFGAKSDYGEADANENYRLPNLNALEIRVAPTEGLSFDEQFIGSLDKFKISFGDGFIFGESETYSGILAYESLYRRSGSIITTVKDKFPNILLKKTDYIQIHGNNEFVDLVPQFDQEGFRSLRYLSLRDCNDLKCIADGRTMSNLIAFPCLEDLTLLRMASLEMVCHGDVSPQTFANLLDLNISSSEKLLCGLPLVPRNLKKINLCYCKLLKFVFIEDEDVPPIELPFLKSLFLDDLPCLLSLVGPKKCNNTSDALQTPQFLFDGKIVLPSLERFDLSGCDNFVKLWSKEISASEFRNLRDITVYRCDKLSSFGSPYVFSNLVQLENLSISYCDGMHEVISSEETQESGTRDQIIRFPRLTCLELKYLGNLDCFYGGESELEFPKLKKLILDALWNMNRFAKLENSSALFHKKINFPCLEELQLTTGNEEVTGLWDKQSSSITNPVPMLRILALGSSSGLQQLPPVILENLSSVTLVHFHDDDSVFLSSNSGEEEKFVSIYSQMPNLEKLKVEDNESVKELFRKEEFNAIVDTLTPFCGQLKTLELNFLPELNVIPLHLFKSITSLALTGLKWDYLISAPVLEDSLQQLQSLSILYCENMEALVINVGSQINFPSLKQLQLSNLACLIGISSTPKKEVTLHLPLLESLKISYCANLEHFWSGTIIAPKLQKVDVSDNNNIKQVFVGNPEEPIELPSLQSVFIARCRFMESITSASLIAPKLRRVQIWECDNMRCFFPTDQNGDGDLHLLSLMYVVIEKCPNLQAFSARRVVAPQLTEICYWGNYYSMLPFDDLNHFLKKINHRRRHFYR